MNWAEHFVEEFESEFGRHPWSWRFILQAWPLATFGGLALSFLIVAFTLELFGDAPENRSLHPFDLVPVVIVFVLGYFAITKTLLLLKALRQTTSYAVVGFAFLMDLFVTVMLAQCFYYLSTSALVIVIELARNYGDWGAVQTPDVLEFLGKSEIFPAFSEPFTVGYYAFFVMLLAFWGMALSFAFGDGSNGGERA